MISILIVDDHPLMRKGIRTVLEAHDDIRVIGEASNGLEAVEYARQLQPSVILMDINMPHMDGVQATRLIKSEKPAVTIIGLSVNEEATRLIKSEKPAVTIIGLSVNEAASVRRAMDQAGASTFLNKEEVGDDLYHTIARLMTNPAV